MRIDEKVITGMFRYHDDITFTESDFVISPNNSLYVVIKETVGRNPDLGYSDYYVPYSSGEQYDLATYEDFTNYLGSLGDDSELGNKVVTLGLLSQILDTYLMGIDGSGKIRNKIFSNEIWFTNYLGDITKTTCDNNPLDILMESSEINHGYFVIEDRILLENFISDINSYNVSGELMGIMRQYTYDNEFNYTIRIQEIIEVVTGNIFYRYAINTEKKNIFDKDRISTWRGYLKIKNILSDGSVIMGDKSNSWENLDFNNALTNISNDIGTYVENVSSSTTSASAML